VGVDGVGLLVLVVGGLIAAGVAYAAHRKRVRKEESLQRLLDRDPALIRTTAPCGIDGSTLPHRFAAIPVGDRRCGLRYGVSGPTPVAVAGTATPLECAAFQWWWEERRTEHTQQGTRTRYVERRTSVALLRLPTPVGEPVVLRPESVLGRVGLTRGGHQLESSEFNRRFRVECRDRTATIHLLDAGLQELLTSHFAGRTIELRGEYLALAGRPDHRDTSLEGVVGELPAVRQDAARVVAAIPPQFWRSVGLADV
jgi:hypothetical protein